MEELESDNWHSIEGKPPVTERFLILAREAGPRSKRLQEVLAPLGTVEVIVDRVAVESNVEGRCLDGGTKRNASTSVYISDSQAEGYGGLLSRSGPLPVISAWSRAFVYLEWTLRNDEAVWFIEDDVAGNAETFAEFVKKTAARSVDLAAMGLRSKCEHPSWPWWEYADGFFDMPYHGFHPLCRLSFDIIRVILEFRRKHGKFTFVEVMIPSLAICEGMTWLDWKRDAEFRHYVPWFRYRPEVTTMEDGICHPVKNPEVHAAICSAPPPEFPRLALAKCQEWSIGRDDYVFLVRYCRRYGLRRAVEYGSGDSTSALLDAGCRVISYEFDLEWLPRSLEWFEGDQNVKLVHCPPDTLPNLLPFEPELVFVNSPPTRGDRAMSRLHVCEWALKVCGHFLLSDLTGDGEKAILQELERRGMQVTRIPTRKGLAVVTDPVHRPEMLSPAMTSALARYTLVGGCSWLGDDLSAWCVLLETPEKPVRVLDVGTGDGVGACLMLDLLFTHPKSEVHGVGLYDGETEAATRQAFEKNAAAGGHVERLHLYEGASREVLAWMIAEEGYWESFDFVHLAALGNGPELLADACQAWALLKPGGLMAIAATEDKLAAVEGFLAVYTEQLQKVLMGSQIVVKKVDEAMIGE